MKRVVIAGGGIGGLTLGCALRERGFEVLVLERAPVIAAIGAGITMQANAMKAFAALGIADAVTKEGMVAKTTRLLGAGGRILSEVSCDRLERILGAPIVCMHRARLQAVLMQRLGDDAIKLGKTVRGYRETEDGVIVECDDGSTECGDLLVGADGINSVVRSAVSGADPLRYAGYTAWRGVSTETSLQSEPILSETWGSAARFGIVPIGHGEIYWFAVADCPQGQVDSPDHLELKHRFEHWHAPCAELIETTPPERIIRTDIYDREPILHWTKGRAVLLGDAAHPMTPNLGQGGCQAIEDAVVLAESLAVDWAGALARYEKIRIARANAIVLKARAFGRWGRWSNPIATTLRDTMVRMTPRSLVEKQMIEVMRFTLPSPQSRR